MSSVHKFVKLPHAVIDHADLDAHELLVYIALVRFRDPKTGTCYPGMSVIADAARVSTKTASRVIGRLEKRGIIKVKRVKAVGSLTNESNKYTVSLLEADPMKYLGHSAKGTRVPKRLTSTDSEPLPSDIDAPGRDSESLRKDSESVGVRTPSPTKKNHLKKNHKEDMTPTFSEVGVEFFSFDLEEDPKASEKQVAYIRDLVIIIHFETRGGIPHEGHLERWREFTQQEATQQILAYLKQVGRVDARYYPKEGDAEYEALSEAGKAFADSAGDPASLWEYTQEQEEAA